MRPVLGFNGRRKLALVLVRIPGAAQTSPFTRYGIVPAKVTVVLQDAVQDEKSGLVFQARLLLERASLQVNERLVTLAPGMSITAEMKISRRRIIEYILDPIVRTAQESLREQ